MSDPFGKVPREMQPGAEEQFQGEVDRVVFSSESGFTVARVKRPGTRDPITVVGKLPGLRAGETIHVKGRWKLDPKFGEQLEVDSYRAVLPATVEGIRRYLASGMVKNIGPEMAKRIVAKFGEKTLQIIDDHPERLAEVEGIGKKRVAAVKVAWEEQREIRSVMVWLQGHGVSPAYAHRIYKRFGAGAARVVQENPYRLAEEVFGIGFKMADAIARRVGIAEDSPARVEAGVLFTLTDAAGEGHCYLPMDDVARRAGELLGPHGGSEAVDGERIDAAAKRLAEDGRATLDEGTLWQPELASAEAAAAARLRVLLEAPPRGRRDLDAAKALAWAEEKTGRTFAPAQRDAIAKAAGGKVTVITGGPGTGKTTVVDALCRIVMARRERILLAAPTGRAAKRLAEATGLEAKTVHRLLEIDPRRGGFQRNASNPLDCDVLVVDETSMVDLPLFRAILEAVPDGARLVLVGDADQLPSVGPGNVLRDVIASGRVPTVRLSQIFRQRERSGIVDAAHLVNAGEMPPDDAADFFVVVREEPEEAVATIAELVAERIPRRWGLDPTRDVQVLAPMNRGIAGTANLNQVLQARLNPDGREIVAGPRRFRIGDRVLQIRNDYDKEVYNGDLGRVVAWDEDTLRLDVEIDGRVVPYESGDADDLRLAYASSIHRSQGSEYAAVVVPVLTQHFVMLQRNLLYTAITRGKKLVVLVGSKKAIGMAVRNDSGRTRFTRLQERLA